MVKITIIFAILLIVLGLGSYLLTGSQSMTALIPTFFGIVILIFGILARNERWRKHFMHANIVLAAFGLAGSFAGIPNVFTLIAGGEVLRPAAAISQAVMALFCILYLILGLKSFIDARRKPIA